MGDLAYCRWREPALLLHSGVGAARGRRSFRGAGSLRPDRAGRRSRRPGCSAFGGCGSALARVGAGRDDPRGRFSTRDRPYRRRHPAGEDSRQRLVDHHGRGMDARGGQDGAAAVAARTARAAGMDPGGRLSGRRPLSARPRSARTGHPLAARVGPDASRDRAHPDRHPPRSARASDQWPSPAIEAGRERGGTSRRRRRVVGVASGLAALLDPRFGESVCIGPPKGAKLSGARRRRNVGVSEFQRNFRGRPVILPAGRSRRGAGIRDGA